jgi:hypothetical protein
MRFSVRHLFVVVLGATIVSWGCARTDAYKFNGPATDAFTGRLVHTGQPVSFPAEEQVFLKVMLPEKAGRTFQIPIQSDGTFQYGWMPAGKYQAMLIRKSVGRRTSPYNLPEFTIEEGKTEYTIDMGPNWKQ